MISVPDLINGAFEASGSLFICLSIRKLYHDKLVRGVHIAPVTFFAVWGFWNMFYYPHLDQWISFAGGLAIVTANVVWIGQMIYYTMNEPEAPNFGHVPISISEPLRALKDKVYEFAADESSGGKIPFWKDTPFKD